MCQYARVGCEFESTKKYIFKDNITCKSANVVYGIVCDKCRKLVYVGETGTAIYSRMANHISSINTKKGGPIPKHFIMLQVGIQSMTSVGWA